MVNATIFVFRREAGVPVHQEEGEWAEMPRHRQEDPGGELSHICFLVSSVCVVLHCATVYVAGLVASIT